MMCSELRMNAGSLAKSRRLLTFALFIVLSAAAALFMPKAAFAYTLSNDQFNVEIGSHGEISSLQLTGDLFPTNYVMNASNAPNQNTSDHQWLGELMFTYRLDNGAWTKAWTNKSASGRKMSQNGNSVTVTYENAADSEGIRNFKVAETYSLVDDYLYWQINVTNTSGRNLEIGDFGLPAPFNEYWSGGDAIYETRTVFHSITGNNSSYITVTRPSGLGPFLLMVPDAATGAGFEYQDHWRVEEHPGSTWSQDQGGWANGLNVFYIHSNVIKSTNRGYLPNTSLILAPNQSKTYAFKFFKVADHDAVKDRLYSEGLIDVTVVPGMIFATDMTAKVDLHTSKTIKSVTAQYPSETSIKYLNTVGKDHKIYELKLNHLGANNITVEYGNGEKTVLQFYAIEPIGNALQRHATFMVEKTQWNAPGKIYDKVFDDWMMDTKSKRGVFDGYWGWGDDWGYTHGQFLAEKNVLVPVPSEVTAVDQYLETAIWNQLMKEHQSDYLIHDFLMPDPNTTPTYRGYAYPHIYNTYFSMYKIAKLYPNLVSYIHPRNTYLLRAYNIMKALYGQGVAYNWDTGLMGELTTPEIIQALEDEGYTNEANDIKAKMATKYNNFKNTTYPYGSEYSYDNTGEEAVYTLAKMNGNKTMMSKINTKTRATRGMQPVWYYYAIPVTICGENWWNFQYTTSLAGYTMDDWLRNHSTTPEKDERMSYAAKIANIANINSGQINSDPANIGAVAWTYQAEKGNFGAQGLGGGALHNGWRGMSGEADLGLFGALKILSADVAVDPVFGLFGYGADVVQSGSNYVITPKDGVFKRLHLITEKFSMELERDQYTAATVATAKNYVNFTLKNLTPATAHTTKVTFTGLSPGTYDILVDNAKAGTVTAKSGAKTVVELNIGTAGEYDVKLQAGSAGTNNTAPVVSAGADSTFTLPADIVLAGTASDDGLPNGTLTTTWSLESGPGTAAIANAGALNTTAKATVAGTYVFKLTASDGSLTSTSKVTMTVKAADSTATDVVAFYPFNETSGTTAADASGNGNHAALQGAAAWAAGKSGNAVSLDGTNGYAALPAGIVSNLNDFTVAAWVKVNKLSDWERIFDFGTGTNTYMFLTPQAGGAGLRFAISTGSNSAEQQLNASAPLAEGVWKHVAVTLSGNTGILYVDGAEAARNTNMTLKPSSLGATTQNYIGRSQWNDPYFNGLIDDFRIYKKALSASEIGTLTGSGVSATNIAPKGTASTSYVSPWESLKGLNDGYEPASSNDRNHPVYGNWDNPGTTQWVQYDFTKNYTISGMDVYWFADGEGIDVPVSCSVQYWNGSAWVNVSNPSGLGVKANQYNKTTFTPVTTNKIRLLMTAKQTLSTGIEQWKVYGY